MMQAVEYLIDQLLQVHGGGRKTGLIGHLCKCLQHNYTEANSSTAFLVLIFVGTALVARESASWVATGTGRRSFSVRDVKEPVLVGIGREEIDMCSSIEISRRGSMFSEQSANCADGRVSSQKGDYHFGIFLQKRF